MAAKAAMLPGCEYPGGELDRWPGAADSQVSVSSPDRLRSRARDLLLIPRVDPLASPHFVTPKLNLFCFIYFFNLYHFLFHLPAFYFYLHFDRSIVPQNLGFDDHFIKMISTKRRLFRVVHLGLPCGRSLIQHYISI